MSEYEKGEIDYSPVGPNVKALVDRRAVEQTGEPRIWKQVAEDRWSIDYEAEAKRRTGGV